MLGEGKVKLADLVAALWSDVWQKRKRTSLSVLVKAYLPDILIHSYSALAQSLGVVQWRLWIGTIYRFDTATATILEGLTFECI